MQNSNDALLITLNRLATYDELIKEYISTNVPTDIVTFTPMTDSDGNILEDKDFPVLNINNIDDSKTSEDKTWSSSKINNELNTKSNNDHEHTKSDIIDFPASLPASDVYNWAKSATKPTYTAAEVGAIGDRGDLASYGVTRLADISNKPGTYVIENGPSYLTDWPSELTSAGITCGVLIVHPAGRFEPMTLVAVNILAANIHVVHFWAEPVRDSIYSYSISATQEELNNHKQAYTSSECADYSADDNKMGVTPAAVKKAFTVFDPKEHTHQRIVGTDTRSTALSPSDIPEGISIHLKHDSTNSLPGSYNYHSLLTFHSWHDLTGAKIHELAFSNSGNIYHRNSVDADNWTSWEPLIRGTNITCQSMVSSDTTPTTNGQINWTYQ